MTGPNLLALYIHWPFCLSKCPYCDFNSHVRETVDAARWKAALLADLDATAAETPDREIASVFFGGGTPSLMPPDIAAALLARIAARWTLAEDVEITLEANPTSVETRRLADFRAAGVNRVSLGVQALDDAALAFLGREHDAAEALAAVATAARLFHRFSFDLIYGRPGQDAAAWADELTRALGHAGGHLSAYQLTLEPGTPFHALWRRGRLKPVGEDLAAALYETTQAVLAGAGMPAYEVSNHAAPGQECRHNLIYWRGGDYVGIGPGAHGRLTIAGTRTALRRARAPEDWLRRVEQTGHGVDAREPLTTAERLDETLLMGLRLAEGIPESRLIDACGKGFDAAFDAARLEALIAGGFLTRDGARLRATPAGRARLDSVIAHLLG